MKKYLVTGFVILTPVALTILIIGFLFNLFTEPLVKMVEPLLQKPALIIPSELVLFISRVLSLFLLIIFIFLLGALMRWFVGKQVVAFTNKILYKIPFIRSVYKVSRDVISAIFSTDGKKAFKKPVMVPFPEKPVFSIGFHAGEVAKECQEKIKTPLMSVFMPTAPHPISGFLFLMPKSDVYDLDMTNEDAFKFLVSCGLIHPDKKSLKPERQSDFP